MVGFEARRGKGAVCSFLTAVLSDAVSAQKSHILNATTEKEIHNKRVYLHGLNLMFDLKTVPSE
jgi:hypothetical protein